MTWGSQIHKYKLVTKLLIYGPFNKEWYQVFFTRLKWSLVPPDFKECLQDIHENFSNLLKSGLEKFWKHWIYKKSLFWFEDVSWLHNSASKVSINNLIYIHGTTQLRNEVIFFKISLSLLKGLNWHYPPKLV